MAKARKIDRPKGWGGRFAAPFLLKQTANVVDPGVIAQARYGDKNCLSSSQSISHYRGVRRFVR